MLVEAFNVYVLHEYVYIDSKHETNWLVIVISVIIAVNLIARLYNWRRIQNDHHHNLYSAIA